MINSIEYPKSDFLNGGPTLSSPVVETVAKDYSSLVKDITATKVKQTQTNIETLLRETLGQTAELTKATQLNTVEAAALADMEKIASLLDPVNLVGDVPYIGTAEGKITAWYQTMKKYYSNAKGNVNSHEKLNRAFQKEYGLTDQEARAVYAWTDVGRTVDQVFLPKAFPKLPKFEGYLVRSTHLHEEEVAALETALSKGSAIDAEVLVIHHAKEVPQNLPKIISSKYPPLPKSIPGMTKAQNAAFQAKNQELVAVAARAEFNQPKLKVMATSMAGRGIYQKSNPYRFIIRSKEGRYISPLSKSPGENEVIYLSGAKFKVLGKAKLPYDVTAYFFDELSAGITP